MMDYKFNRHDKDFKRYINSLDDAALILGGKIKDTKGGYYNPNALELDIYPVIPVELPVEDFHQVYKDAATGEFLPKLDKQNNKIPFSPKAPAYWKQVNYKDENGEYVEKIIRKGIQWGGSDTDYTPKQFDSVVNFAKNNGLAIGIAVGLTRELVVVDFDVKPYATPDELEAHKNAPDAQAAKEALEPALARMEAAVHAWQDQYPITRSTRAEITPSGGYHFWFRVADAMASWADGTDANGKAVHHVRFCIEGSDDEAGDVLCGRICVCAPTQNGRGPYRLIKPELEGVIITIDNLAEVGLRPAAQSKRQRVQKQPDGSYRKVMRQAPPLPQRVNADGEYEPPRLLSLLGKRAIDVFNGQLAYRGTDRSYNLTGFINELFAWIAFLHDQGLPYDDDGRSPEDFIHEAAQAIGLDDDARVQRIIKSTSGLELTARLSISPDAALKRYALRQGGELPPSFSGLKETERNPFALSVTDLRTRLQELVARNLGNADVAFELKAIAEEFEEPLHTVKDLFKQLNAEASEEDEASSALSEFIRTQSQSHDLTGVLPTQLARELLTITRTAKYETPVIFMTLLSACSAAMPLSSTVNCCPAEAFVECLNVWFILLMDSGELKSPLLRRIIIGPYRAATKTVLNRLRYVIEEILMQARNQEPADICDSLSACELLPPQAVAFIESKVEAVHAYANTEVGRGENAAKPSPEEVRNTIQQLIGPNPQLLLTGGGTKQGLDAEFEANTRWAGKGLLYLQDEMKALFIKLAKPAATESDFAPWLLSRYDGTGQYEAKGDATRVRNYDSCRISVIGGVQPTIYRDTLSDDDASGMTARFNVYEQPTVDQEFPDEFSPAEILSAQQLSTTLESLYEFILSIPQLDLRLSADAFRRFQAFRRRAFQTKRAEITDAGKSLANKAHGKVGRIAAILHVIHYAAGANYDANAIASMSPVISDDSMERAIRLHDLLYQRTLGVRLSSGENSPTAQTALKLHRMAKGKPDGVTLNAMRSAFKSNSRPSMAEVLAICTELQQQGVGRLEAVSYRGRQGHRYFHTKDI